MGAYNGEVVKVVPIPGGGTAMQVIIEPPKPPRRYPVIPCPPTEMFNEGEKVTFDLIDPSGGQGGPEVAYNIAKIPS